MRKQAPILSTPDSGAALLNPERLTPVVGRESPQSYLDIPLADVMPSRLNPRGAFDEDAMEELAESIRENGLLQPIRVRRKGDIYEIIAGERRYRACKKLGLSTISCVIDDCAGEDRDVLMQAIVENDVRRGIDSIARAKGYLKLAQMGVSPDEIARKTGKSPAIVKNSLRLLDLPKDVQDLVAAGRINSVIGGFLLRYADFDGLALAVARLCIEKRGRADDFASGNLPFAIELEEAGAIARLDSAATVFKFSEICRQCPFGAYVRLASGAQYCLKLEHYDALQRQQGVTPKRALRAARMQSNEESLNEILNGHRPASKWKKRSGERLCSNCGRKSVPTCGCCGKPMGGATINEHD